MMEGAGMARKLRVEITLSNWRCMKNSIGSYDDDPRHVTPRYKSANVVNEALDRFFSTSQQAPRACIAADQKK
jgi:hypothetical protein